MTVDPNPETPMSPEPLTFPYPEILLEPTTQSELRRGYQ